MPLPFLLAGVALLAGGYGVKKGFDAKKDFRHAEELQQEAQSIFDEASEDLDRARLSAQDALESLGALKFDLYQNSLIPFVDAFSKIKHIDFQDNVLKEELRLMDVDQADMLSVQAVTIEMSSVVGGGVTALGAGGLAGLAAYGGVGALATTAGGTAIAGLSGVAATNATLAWLGGGALSAGGFGVAGGTAVLGGIVAGPVLAIGGMMMASKAEEAKQNAYTNRAKARAAAEEMQTAQTVTEGIERRVREIHGTLLDLNQFFLPLLTGLQHLVTGQAPSQRRPEPPKGFVGFLKRLFSKGAAAADDYRSYSIEDRKGVMMAAAMAKTIKNVMEAPVLDTKGAVTSASRKVMHDARAKLAELNSL